MARIFRISSFRAAAIAVASTLFVVGCSRLGFTDRVLLRIPSPDGSIVAVCQEVPALDGPGYSVRLERPDGRLVRDLYEIGDGDPCSEIAWSPGGETLAVLSAHVARVRFVDVAWAVQHQSVEASHWTWPHVSLASEGQFILAKNMVFDGLTHIELQVCPYRLEDRQRSGRLECDAPPYLRSLQVPAPAHDHP